MTSAATLLREARRRAGLTPVALARRAGVTQSVVSAYASGSRRPSLSTLERLVGATGLELDLRLRRPRSRLRRLTGPPGRRLRAHRGAVRDVAARHGVTHVRDFGSAARGEDTALSDVDLWTCPMGSGSWALPGSIGTWTPSRRRLSTSCRPVI